MGACAPADTAALRQDVDQFMAKAMADESIPGAVVAIVQDGRIGTYTMREPMHAVEARLPSRQFARLNRSVLVNVDAICEIQPYFRGDFAVVLRDGSHVITGRTYRERIRRRFSLV